MLYIERRSITLPVGLGTMAAPERVAVIVMNGVGIIDKCSVHSPSSSLHCCSQCDSRCGRYVACPLSLTAAGTAAKSCGICRISSGSFCSCRPSSSSCSCSSTTSTSTSTSTTSSSVKCGASGLTRPHLMRLPSAGLLRGVRPVGHGRFESILSADVL